MTVAVDANIKTTLPPRKRARTQEEKEQRRVERILRNRRAAHASREKKRRHVEFLEAYVLSLETNLSTLSQNYNKVRNLLEPSKVSLLNLPQLEDLSSLKNQIHLNMSLSSGSRKASAILDELNNEKENDLDLEEDMNASTASSEVNVKAEQSEPSLKLEETEATQEDRDDGEPPSKKFLSTSSAEYFNYLLPVSMNSPVNSPLDLTLKKNEDNNEISSSASSSSAPNTPEQAYSDLHVPFKSSLLDSATSGIDLMAQNSAAILSPQAIGV